MPAGGSVLLTRLRPPPAREGRMQLRLSGVPGSSNAKPRDIKKVANALVTEGELMFWSSGSTTMYARPDRIQNEEK